MGDEGEWRGVFLEHVQLWQYNKSCREPNHLCFRVTFVSWKKKRHTVGRRGESKKIYLSECSDKSNQPRTPSLTQVSPNTFRTHAVGRTRKPLLPSRSAHSLGLIQRPISFPFVPSSGSGTTCSTWSAQFVLNLPYSIWRARLVLLNTQ